MGDSGPRPFGLTGYLVPTASRLRARSKGHGVLILSPQGTCDSPSVPFYPQEKEAGGVIGIDEVTFTLAGLL